MEEIWKDVVGYEGLYKASNLGNVYSCYVNRVLKPGTHKDGYKFVILRKDKKKSFKTIHRLVAEAFIKNPNPDKLLIVNHKDENPENNSVDNLEWCDYVYNNTYNEVHMKRAKSLSKTTYVYDCNGKLVYEFSSSREASRRLNISCGDINNCCTNRTLTYKNFVWSYKELSKQEVLDKFELSKELNGLEVMQKKNNKLSKPIDQYDLDGNFINTYPSIHEASRQLGFGYSSIAGVCRGEHKQTHGFVFKYAS